ncbi:MAG: vWA domain-containing protein, partial [Bacteroidales bacterium]
HDANIAISVLVDCSGSMSGYKLKVASQSAYLICNALEKAGRPSIVNCFDTQFYPIKSYKQKSSPKLFADMSGKGGGGTSEGMALEKVINEFKKVEAGKKLIIVINDGCPDNSDRLKSVIANCPKTINLFAIGIESEYVKEFYKDYIELKDINTLPDVLIKKFKQLAGHKY